MDSGNVSNIFKGNKYRITIITERLVRLEYSEDGIFNDLPTSLVNNRKFDSPSFEVEDGDTILKISTKYFTLKYRKDKSFYGGKFSPTKNLMISLNDTEKVWYYNHPEIRCFDSYVYTEKGKLKSVKGLYSLDGFSSIIDDSNILDNGEYKAKNSGHLDIYVFLYNKDFYKCLNDYFNLTGRPIMIPRYALGNWFYKEKFYEEEELPKRISKFKREDVPLSIFLLDKWYKDESLNINTCYNDIRGVVDYFNEKNVKIGLTLNCSNNNGINLYNKDILNTFVNNLNELGINIYNLNVLSNKDLSKLELLKDLLYKKLDEGNERVLINSPYTKGSHKNSIVYSGKSEVSFKTLNDIIKINTSASNIGMSYFNHDIGGTVNGIEDNELFIRFVQLGVFSPILKLGSTNGKYYKREPWKWDIKTNKITSDFLNLRYKLIPYIYTECYKYYKYGKPLIEPIYYRYKDFYDSDVYKNGYFFGGSIYVSPICKKKNETMDRVIHKLFIPHGVWYDFFTGKKFYGNKKYISFYKDEEYPVFVKAGSIIPMSLEEYNYTNSPVNMEIDIFPGASNTYSIYEDDGITDNYKNDRLIITNVEYIFDNNAYKLTILPVVGRKNVIADLRNYKLVFKNTKNPDSISCFQGKLPVDKKCYVDGTDFIVEVKNIKTVEQFTVILKGNSLEIDSMRIVNDDIVSIISDLKIETEMKQIVDDIIFNQEIDIKKKRIKLKHLAHIKKPLDKKYINLFLNLLEYIEKV